MAAAKGSVPLREELKRERALKAELLAALKGALGALEQDVDAGADYNDADWYGIAHERLAAARAAIAKAS